MRNLRDIRFTRYSRLTAISAISIISGIVADYFNKISVPAFLVDITGITLVLAFIFGFISVHISARRISGYRVIEEVTDNFTDTNYAFILLLVFNLAVYLVPLPFGFVLFSILSILYIICNSIAINQFSHDVLERIHWENNNR